VHVQQYSALDLTPLTSNSSGVSNSYNDITVTFWSLSSSRILKEISSKAKI
jgi:hypothetical protein